MKILKLKYETPSPFKVCQEGVLIGEAFSGGQNHIGEESKNKLTKRGNGLGNGGVFKPKDGDFPVQDGGDRDYMRLVKKVLLIMAIIVTFIGRFTADVLADNCPNGTEKLTYTFESGTFPGGRTGTKWWYRPSGIIKVTLNCDQTTCVSQLLASVDVYCDYSAINGNAEGFDGGGYGGAFPVNPLCNKGQFARITVCYYNKSDCKPVSAYWYKEIGGYEHVGSVNIGSATY